MPPTPSDFPAFLPDGRPHTADAAALGQWIERAAAIDALAAVPAAQRPRLDPFVAREPGVVGYGLPGLPSTMLNRIFVGGEGSAPSAEAVGRVLERFAARGVERFFAHVASDAATPAVLAALRARGVERYHRAWIKLARNVAALREPLPAVTPAVTTSLTVREATLDDSAAFADLIVRCHGALPAAAPLLAALVSRPRWHVYVACDGARPVAAGALTVLGDVGYLGYGATDPAYRRRGAQRALLAKRMRVAVALGCRWIFSDTGEAIAGQPNPSFDNMRRLGLEPIARRDNHAPAGVGWG